MSGETLTKISLQPFCYEGEWPTELKKPWSRGEYTYATNGHIMIRVPRRDDDAENEKAPDASRVTKVPDAPLEAIRWSVFPPEEKPIECARCEGSGSQAPCGCDCQACECEHCDGKGEIGKKQFASFRGRVFSAHYLRQIMRLGASEAANPTDPSFASLFVGNGFEIWLMPVRDGVEPHFNALAE